MTLQIIEIQNVKGISNLRLTLNILPNRPSILVAPNGFGKSSLTAAFQSLNNNRILLNEELHHQEDVTNMPRLRIVLQKPDGTVSDLHADHATNTISSEISHFVINNQVKAKGVGQAFGGRVNVSASLNIDPIVLIDKIPENIPFTYSVSLIRAQFGPNGKILPNISDILANSLWIERIFYKWDLLKSTLGKRPQKKIGEFKSRVNTMKGSSDAILSEIDANEIGNLNDIQFINELAAIVSSFNRTFSYSCEPFLIVLELVTLFSNDTSNFEGACLRKVYEHDKQRLQQLIEDFNPTWKAIRPRETEGQLVLHFPKTHLISNGQRDVLCFIALLQRAKRKFRRQHCILIIDEVFDYLDDANLIAAQFYITELINELHRQQGKQFYPLVLTHINPYYFKTYAFSKQKVYYLLQGQNTAATPLQRLITHREDPSIVDDVSKFLLHYHPGQINKRAEFVALGLRANWGEANNFQVFVDDQLARYLRGEEVDPFAVCCAVRRKIEEKVYRMIIPGHQTTFLNTHKTIKKLEFAESIGVQIPEVFFLLGLVYNEGLHWQNNQDNTSVIVSRINNGTIKHMIRRVFNN